MNLDEVRKFLDVAAAYKGGKLVPYVTLALFAAIRPTELARITWDNIDLEAGTVTIGAKMAKMRQRRIVDMACLTENVEIVEKGKKGKKGKKPRKAMGIRPPPANLIAWLKPHAAAKNPFRGANWRKDFDAVKLATGFGNPDLKPAGDGNGRGEAAAEGVETVDTGYFAAHRDFKSSGLFPARGQNRCVGRQQPGHNPAPLQRPGETGRRQRVLDDQAADKKEASA